MSSKILIQLNNIIQRIEYIAVSVFRNGFPPGRLYFNTAFILIQKHFSIFDFVVVVARPKI